MSEGPTDRQLTAIVRHLARLHLEIERGVRPPEQLTALMRPEAEHFWRRQRENGIALPGGPARDRDLGPVHLRRTDDGQALATVTTPTHPARWGALTFVLRVDGRNVSIRQAKRLHAGLDYGRTVNVVDDQLPDRLVNALEERRLVLAALQAAETDGRNARAAPTRPVEPQARNWRNLVEQLDTEIRTLMRTDLQRHFLHEPPRRS